MNDVIRNDFVDFINNEDYFNSSVKLYDSLNVLKFDGKGVYDKKPMPVQNENGMVSYQGHMSILTLSMSLLTFMTAYFSLKGYKVEITDNVDLKSYTIANSNYNSNVGSIYCELKEL